MYNSIIHKKKYNHLDSIYYSNAFAFFFFIEYAAIN